MTLSVPVVHVASRDHSLTYLHDPVSVPVVHVASRDLHDPVSTSSTCSKSWSLAQLFTWPCVSTSSTCSKSWFYYLFIYWQLLQEFSNLQEELEKFIPAEYQVPQEQGMCVAMTIPYS
jgi:hypothetical protein